MTILVVDPNLQDAAALTDAIGATPESGVARISVASSLEGARQRVFTGAYNVLVIDPIGLGVDRASEFIVQTDREKCPLAVVLYMDAGSAEAGKVAFYRGQWAQSGQLPTIDKKAPEQDFGALVADAIQDCRDIVRQADSRKRVVDHIASARRSTSPSEIAAILNDVSALLPEAVGLTAPAPRVAENSVFLSYRLDESDYLAGLTGLLQSNGFSVVTGTGAEGFVSSSVLRRIQSCRFFVCLMTRAYRIHGTDTYTTSAWVLEEKGAALALGKQIILLVEDGVVGIGGLQGDWQRHTFTPKQFMARSFEAVRQLRGLAGMPD